MSYNIFDANANANVLLGWEWECHHALYRQPVERWEYSNWVLKTSMYSSNNYLAESKALFPLPWARISTCVTGRLWTDISSYDIEKAMKFMIWSTLLRPSNRAYSLFYFDALIFSGFGLVLSQLLSVTFSHHDSYISYLRHYYRDLFRSYFLGICANIGHL